MRTIDLVAGIKAISGSQWPGVEYFCTLRQGGVSQPPRAGLNLGAHVQDQPEHVHTNRQLLYQSLPRPALWLDQVHGTDVLTVDAPYLQRQRTGCDAGQSEAPVARADALVTLLKNVPLAILTADCLPVVLADAQARVLGLAHAGWRGLLHGVLENTIARMRALCPQAGDGSWQVWIGPGIGPQAFQVGAEVHAAFVTQDHDYDVFFRPDGATRFMADLPGLAQARLNKLGIDDVQLSQQCTFSNPLNYFSYRRNPQTGRQATVAWLA